MRTMLGWGLVFIVIWLTSAIAVDVSLKWTPPGAGKIKSFRILWVVGSLAGLALIMTGILGYMIDGLTISTGCFAIMLWDHRKQKEI